MFNLRAISLATQKSYLITVAYVVPYYNHLCLTPWPYCYFCIH